MTKRSCDCPTCKARNDNDFWNIVLDSLDDVAVEDCGVPECVHEPVYKHRCNGEGKCEDMGCGYIHEPQWSNGEEAWTQAWMSYCKFRDKWDEKHGNLEEG